MRSQAKLTVGAILMAVSIVGFLTVADDWRHSGELAAAIGILISGIGLVIAAKFPSVNCTLALSWLPVGVAAGMAFGVVTDRVAVGVGLGAVLGMVLARLLRQRV